MPLTKPERKLLQDVIHYAVSYNVMVSLAAVEDHNCLVHGNKDACDLRDSMSENARFAMEDFNKAMERLLPFTGPKLD